MRGAAERFYSFWTEVWTAAQRRSLSRRDFTATVEYGPIELSDAGEYVGYTPVDAALQPVARRPHDETLRVWDIGSNQTIRSTKLDCISR